MAEKLGHKVASGIGWTFTSAITVRLLHFLVTIALARLLVPADFGLFALGTIVVTAITLFRDMGIGQALIYHRSEGRQDSDTTFIMSGVFGIAAWMVTFLSANVISRAFGNEHLAWPLRIMSFSVVFSSLATVPSVLLEKELMFRKRAMPEFAMGLSYALISFVLALEHMGVWALVIGHLVSIGLATIVTWKVAGWKPKISFNMESFHRLYAYGKPLMFACLLFLGFFYIDQAAIGKWLGVTALGYYSMAYTICNLPATNITHILTKVMFPTYSKLNNDLPALRSAYLRTVKSIALLSFPIAFGLCLLSNDFVSGFFGHKWIPAIPLFKILAFYGLIRSIGASISPVFMALGEPKWVYKLNFIQLAIAAPLVYPAAKYYGTSGVAILFTAAYGVGTVVGMIKVLRVLSATTSDFVVVFKSPAFVSAATVFASFFIAKALLPAGLFTAVGAGALSVVAYPIAAMTIDKESFQIAKTLINPIRKPGL